LFEETILLVSLLEIYRSEYHSAVRCVGIQLKSTWVIGDWFSQTHMHVFNTGIEFARDSSANKLSTHVT
jgi:hypothetical protein